MKYNSDAEAHSVDSIMLERYVIGLLYLFQISVFDELKLTLVQWFECNWVVEEKTDMYLINKKKKYDVIELGAIERTVHLIP